MATIQPTSPTAREDVGNRNCIAFVVECKEHGTFASRQVRSQQAGSKGQLIDWLPLKRIADNVSWFQIGNDYLNTLLGCEYFKPLEVQNIIHLQPSRNSAWERIVIMTTSLTTRAGTECMCRPGKERNGMKWMPITELERIRGDEKVLGPRVSKTMNKTAREAHVNFTEMAVLTDKHVPDRVTLCDKHKPRPFEVGVDVTIDPRDCHLIKKEIFSGGTLRDASERDTDAYKHLLEMVRGAYMYHIGKRQGALDWWQNEDAMVKYHIPALKILLKNAKQAFESEPRVLRVEEPVHVFGDIHGNLPDLIHYENAVWTLTPEIQDSDYLFLGDYVDRGAWSVECVIYLFCMRLLHPDKFFLIRGNHEVKSLQINFSFKNECLRKFKSKGISDRGGDMWNLFNNAFDEMAIAAVIDNRIFCAHGGIPASETKLAALENIPRKLSDPENTSAIAWEILWNDPITKSEWKHIIEQQRSKQMSREDEGSFKRGFSYNDKRGTAFLYMETAVTEFLLENNLTHVIRAHEMVREGFQFHFDGKVITVFSSSNYQKNKNTAACLLVSDHRIRPIKFRQHSIPTRVRSR